MLLSKSSLWASRIYAEEEVERVKSQSLTLRKVSSRHDRPEAQMNSQRLGQHTRNLHRFKTDRISALKRGNRHKVPPKLRSCLQLILGGQRKFSLFQWGVTGYRNHIQGRPPWQGVVSQHKTASIWSGFDGALFVLGFGVLVLLLLLGCLFVLLIFFMLACLPVLTFKFWLFFIVFHVIIVVVLGENMKFCGQGGGEDLAGFKEAKEYNPNNCINIFKRKIKQIFRKSSQASAFEIELGQLAFPYIIKTIVTDC